MIVDGLMLLGENRFGPTLSVQEGLGIAEQLGVDRVVAAPARPLDYHLEPANERLAEAAQNSEGRLAVLGRVDPLNGKRAVDEAERCLTELGCVGLFLHPAEESFPVTWAGDVLEVAGEQGRPVVVATGYSSLSEPLQVAELAARFTEVLLVLSNGGQINISGLSMVDAWFALTGRPNLLVMTNGEYRQDFIERLARDFDETRVLYASFAPVFDPAFEIKRIRSAAMSQSARCAIEGGNAARLFGLEET
jgi:predicted TIM-barrel fold metal-dependent hydrolase